MKRMLMAVAVGLMLLSSYSAVPAVALPVDFSVGSDSYSVIDVPEYTEPGFTFQTANSGEYLGTVVKNGGGTANDSIQVLEAALAAVGYIVDIVSTSKADEPETAGDGFPLTIEYDVYDDGQRYSGTWSTGEPPNATMVSFYTVKGSTEFAMYRVSPAAYDGGWNTENLLTRSGNLPEVSHFQAVGAPVPEPGTMFLLGSGLLGLGLLRRRRKS